MKRNIKKLNIMVIILTLLAQQFILLPIKAIGATLTDNPPAHVRAVELLNDQGEKITEIESGSEIELGIEWGKAESESAVSMQILLPQSLTIREAVSADLVDTSGETVGSYAYSSENHSLDLDIAVEKTTEGRVEVPISIVSDSIGPKTLEFTVNGEKTTLEVNFTEPKNTEVALESETTESEQSEEPEETAASESVESKTSSEAIDQTEPADDAVNEPEAQNEMIGTYALITESIINSARLTDKDGNAYTAENPYNIDQEDISQLAFDWSIPEDLVITAGDTYEFQLPAQFELPSGAQGILGEVGTWTVTKEGYVTLTFDENVEADDVGGTFWVGVSIDQQEVEVAGSQIITLPTIPIEQDIPIFIAPKSGSLVDKSGTPDRGYNATSSNWTIDINTGLEQLINPEVTDVIPAGMTYVPDSFEMYTLNISIDGARIQGEPVDPSLYTVTVNGDGNPSVVFNNLNDEQAYSAYRMVYSTTIDEAEFDGTQRWTNRATLTNNGQTYDATSTITSGYGQEINKENPAYDPKDQSFDWVVEYNYGEKDIAAEDAVVNDQWNPAGIMDLREDPLVYLVTIDENGNETVSSEPVPSSEYTLVKTEGSGFSIQFNEDINSAYQIRYTTEATGVITGSTGVTNQITTGTGKTDGNRGTFNQQGVIKNHLGTDIGAKRMNWRVGLNGNSYLMEDLVVSDRFTGDGMDLLEETVVIRDGSTVLQSGVDYQLETVASAPGNPGGFTITFIGNYASFNRPLTLEYSTTFERNSDGTATYRNQTTIDWTEDGQVYESNSNPVTLTPNQNIASNGVKSGQYNAQTKQTTWTINTNYARLPIENSYRIEDTLPENQEYVENTFEVYTYTVGANGSITRGETLSPEDYTVIFPNEENSNTLTVELAESFGGQRTAIGLVFNTSFQDGWIQDSEIVNRATVYSGENEYPLTASLQVPYGDQYADKTGAQAGDFGEFIDWSIILNPNGSLITNYTIEDRPSLDSILLEDSFVVYEATVSGNGSIITPTETRLEEGVDYNLEIETNNDTGEQVFTLNFIGEIAEPYVLEYRSAIDPNIEQGSQQISNSYTVSGDNVEISEAVETEVIDVYIAEGGGTGSGTRGSLVLTKTSDAEENPELLSGAVFELYTADGSTLLREGITSEELGEITFGGLRRGEYLLKEVTAPEGYVISDELAEGIIIELTHTTDDPVSELTYTNRRTRVEISKVNQNGDSLPGATFAIYDADDNVVVEDLVTDSEGVITYDGLPEGNYTVRETERLDGYIQNTAPFAFEIDIAEDGTQEIPQIEVTNYVGSASLTKLNEAGEPIEGATFNVLDADENIVAENIESNADGVLTVTGLAPGTYYFEETATVAGYIVNTDLVEFEIAASNEGAPDIVNAGNFVNYQGSVELTKTDEAGNALADVAFSIIDENGDVIEGYENLVSDSDGRVFAEGLAPGTYAFVETSAPEGYLLNTEERTFEIPEASDGQVVVNVGEFVNYQGSASLVKVSEDDTPIEGAQFTVFRTQADGEDIDLELTLSSNSEGEVVVENLSPGTYYFKETAAANGYLLNTATVEFTIAEQAEGEPVLVEAGSFVNYRGSAVLTKVSENNTPLEGAEFRVENADGETIAENITSNENGEVSVTDLAPGTYYFIETKAAPDHILNPTPVEFEIVSEANGQPETVAVGNLVNYQGSVEITKQDEDENGLSGAVFTLEREGLPVRTGVTTEENGSVVVTGLAPGEYTLVETAAPDGYILNTTREITFVIEGTESGQPSLVEVSFVNYQGSASLSKVSATGQPIEGAVFDLLNLDGEVVREGLVSQSDGLVIAEDLEPGSYRFVETAPAPGYLLNTEEMEPFTIEDSSYGQVEVLSAGEYINYLGTAMLVKVGDNGETLEGAVFDVINGDGEVVQSGLTSDETGLVTATDLAPGAYQFVETQAAEGYVLNTDRVDFTIDTEASGVPEIVETGEFQNYLGSATLVKVGNEGEALEGAVFDIVNADGEVVQSGLISDETGLVTATDLAPGAYQFVETQAAEGYVLNTDTVEFSIEDEAAGSPTVVATGEFQNYLGSATLLKVGNDGEALEGAVFDIVNAEDEVIQSGLVSNEAGLVTATNLSPGTYRFVETQSASGHVLNAEAVEFTIEAEAAGVPEAVETGEFQNYLGTATLVKVGNNGEVLEGAVFDVVSEDGTLIQSGLTSNELGLVIATNLSPGTYRFVETQSAEGHLLNTEAVEFTIEAEAVGRPEVVATGEFQNYLGTAMLSKVGDDNEALEGAIFDVINEEDEVVQSGLTSNESGLVIAAELAPGTYRFVETQSAEGHILNTDTVEFTIEAEAAGLPEIVEAGEFQNYLGTATLSKVNDEGEALEGAVFDVVNAEDEVVQSGLVSNEAGLVTATNLSPGTYRFVETQSASGHLLNTDAVEFTIEAEAAGVPAVVETGEFQNYLGTATLSKVNDEGEALEGVVFDVVNAEDEVVQSGLVSNESGLVTAENLSPGVYYFVETQAREGYILNPEPVEFIINESAAGIPTIVDAGELINYQGTVLLNKLDQYGNPLEGATFNLLDADGNIVREGLISAADGQLIVQDLAPGEYSFAETNAPQNYIQNTQSIAFVIEAVTSGEPEVVLAGDFINYQGSMEIIKLDSEDNPLSGAEFEIRDTNDSVIRENLVTDETGNILVEKLAPGTYMLVETKAPEGYQLLKQGIEFTIAAAVEGEPEAVVIEVYNEKEEPIAPVEPTEPEEDPSNGTPEEDAVKDDTEDSQSEEAEHAEEPKEQTKEELLPQTNESMMNIMFAVAGIALLLIGGSIVVNERRKNAS